MSTLSCRAAAIAWSLMVVFGTDVFGYRAQVLTNVVTIPVSPSVTATVVRSDETLTLLILWRGSPGWMSHIDGHRKECGSVGQAGGVFSASFEYGATAFGLSYDATRHLVMFQGAQPLPVPAGTNVLLVDGVDTSSGPRLAGTLILEPGNANLDISRGSLGPLFSRSTEIVGFLRCGVGDASVAVDSKACG